MPDFPTRYGPGRTTRLASNVSIPTPGSTHTKGNWTQLIASTAADYSALHLFAGNDRNSAGSVTYLMDLAVGAAASEVTILSNLMVCLGANMFTPIELPFSIPAGTRISARVQGTNAGTNARATLHGIEGGLWADAPGGRVLSLGIVTANSDGTALDAGGVANTYPASFTTIAASTAEDIAAILPVMGTNRNNLVTDADFRVQVAVGAAAAEVVIAELGFSFELVSTTTGFCMGTNPFWLPAGIPAGTRVSARIMSSTTDATDRIATIGIYGLVV